MISVWMTPERLLCGLMNGHGGNSEIIISLKIHPKSRCGTERLSQPQGRVSGYRPPASDDLIDSHGSNAHASSQLSVTHVHRFQKFVTQNLAGSYGRRPQRNFLFHCVNDDNRLYDSAQRGRAQANEIRPFVRGWEKEIFQECRQSGGSAMPRVCLSPSCLSAT